MYAWVRICFKESGRKSSKPNLIQCKLLRIAIVSYTSLAVHPNALYSAPVCSTMVFLIALNFLEVNVTGVLLIQGSVSSVPQLACG